MNEFSIIFLIFLTTSLLLTLWLNHRQIRYILQHRDEVPAAFKDQIEIQAHQKAANYTAAKTRVSTLSSLLSTILLILFTFAGGINEISVACIQMINNELAAGVALIFSVILLSHFVDIPIELYQTFKIEQKFGFNKTTVKQYLKDQALQLTLMLIIGIPVIYALLWVMGKMGDYWWLYAWALTISNLPSFPLPKVRHR